MREAVHRERRPVRDERLVPGADEVAGERAVFEQGVSLLHHALVGALEPRVALVELHAEAVERRAPHARPALHHIKVVRAEEH